MKAPNITSNARHDEVRAAVAANYPKIAHDLLRPLLDLLSIAREACGGDVDKFLIMLVVAVRTTEHKAFATYTQEELLSGELPVFPGLGTNVRSIAESARVPRETIRRKVGELVEAGWIDRQGHELRFTSLAYQQLAIVRVGIEQLAARDFEVVRSLLLRSDVNAL
ncbi:MAG: hypothetical protein WA840_17575 [Caulobacteraceae bacterium]